MLDPIKGLEGNISEVERLVEIHQELSGDSPGRKYNVEVLNKSSIVLLVACWEAYIEDLAEAAFAFLLANASDHTAFPGDVLTLASRKLKSAADNREVWRLAGDGWRKVLEERKEELFLEYTGRLNTPKPSQIDALFAALIGMSRISNNWTWRTVTADKARSKLEALVGLRGSIAHRVTAATSVRLKTVTGSMSFISRLAVRSSNAVRSHLHKQTQRYPWAVYQFGATE